MAIDGVLAAIDKNLDKSLERLFELLRIPSVSTDPAFAGDCEKAAAWLAAELKALDFDAAVRPTDGRPMVVAHSRGETLAKKPHVLFYGHYDVQPPDPLDLWETPPFEPHIKETDGRKRIVARGSADDKGQLMTFVEACRAFKAVDGKLPVPVTILFEGEEETGSPSLKPFLDANKEELKADVALVCDTDMWDAETPAVTTMLRGLVMEEVIVTGASHDLHSGLFGGPAINPIRVLARVLADIHDKDNRIVIPGFYEGVGEIAPEIRAQWMGLKFDETRFLGDIGLKIPAGEKGRHLLEQMWSRPTCDMNGIIGGYTGEGAKTVIPARASVKVSFRIVGDQDPLKIRDAFRAFVRERLPADCDAEFISHGASPALRLSLDSPYLAKTREALEAEWGKPAVLKGSGGSIPIVGSFKHDLGMDSLLVGFGLDDDRIHSPNEKYDLESFRKGARSWARILAGLAARQPLNRHARACRGHPRLCGCAFCEDVDGRDKPGHDVFLECRRFLLRLRVHLRHIFPVHQVLDERLEIVRAAVAIVDVIGVLPHVAAEDRRAAVHQRAFAIGGLGDADLAVLDGQPGPARAELRDAGLDEVFLHFIDGAEIGDDLLFQFARNLAAAIGLHPLPEMEVVVVLAGIVEEPGILAERALHDLFEAFAFQPGAFEQLIAVVDIGLVVLVVMVFEGFLRHIGRKRVVGVRQDRAS
jgi:acetylornithine deacetylase/succinyl-diaminopimelate desuccinylase-like protein